MRWKRRRWRGRKACATVCFCLTSQEIFRMGSYSWVVILVTSAFFSLFFRLIDSFVSTHKISFSLVKRLVFCASFCCLSWERETRVKRRRRRYTRERIKRFALCLSLFVVFLLSHHRISPSVQILDIIVSERERPIQRERRREWTLLRREEEEQQQEEENGQTRTGTNHRRARVARPHEVGQQEEHTRGGSKRRREEENDERFGLRKKGQEKYGN